MRNRIENFDANRDRGNLKKAEKLFNLLWPNRHVRVACAERLAQSIRQAHKQANASWAVTLHDWGIRLNVGQVLVLQFDSDEVLAYARSSRGKSVYNAVRVPSRKFRCAPTEIATVPLGDWKAHERFISAAAIAKKGSPWRKSFSDGVLKYVEDLLRTELPRPAYFKDSIRTLTLTRSTEVPSDLVEELPQAGTEGHRKLILHLRIERNRSLVERKKRAVLKATHGLTCEVCRFDFRVYENLGEDFCEIHHLRPLSESKSKVRTNLGDLAVVCANCHRMIHRGGQSRSLDLVRMSLKAH